MSKDRFEGIDHNKNNNPAFDNILLYILQFDNDVFYNKTLVKPHQRPMS